MRKPGGTAGVYLTLVPAFSRDGSFFYCSLMQKMPQVSVKTY